MTSLPIPTIELGLAERDLEEFGYCLLRDALTRDQISELSARLSDQAIDEKREGQAFEDGGEEQQWGDFRDELGAGRRDRFRAASGGVNQRVWMLVNKGRCFIDLLYHVDVLELVRSVIGNEFLLSSHTANIAREGGLKMPLHTDQWWMPPPMEPTANPLPVGSMSRTTFEDAPQSVPALIAPATCVM